MKAILRYIIIIAFSIGVSSHAQPGVKPDIDDTSRFIFYSVLEGLYEDGLTNKDVDQILLKNEKQRYYHFIYACPVCGATIWALEAYRGRPERLYGLKREGSTFGDGLSAELHEQLYNDDVQKRLIAINTLMQKWMDRRMKAINLSVKERAVLLEALQKKRKEGMDALESFRKLEHGPNFGVAEAAPAYVDLQECAVCNGAVGKPMKLPEVKPR